MQTNTIEDYDPFDEPNASFQRSVKAKIDQRFDIKTTHKMKCENIRKSLRSAHGEQNKPNIPLTN